MAVLSYSTDNLLHLSISDLLISILLIDVTRSLWVYFTGKYLSNISINPGLAKSIVILIFVIISIMERMIVPNSLSRRESSVSILSISTLFMLEILMSSILVLRSSISLERIIILNPGSTSEERNSDRS